MSRDIVAVEPETTVREALSRMEQHKIHELPVMQKSSLKGWVNFDTLIQRAHMPAASKVTSVMVPGARIAQSTDAVAAADLMIRQNVRAMAVVDAKGQIVGILSRTDLLRAALDVDEITSLPLDRVMTRDLETAADSASIDEAARRLRELNIRHLIVLDRNGKFVGTVGREVVTHALTNEDRRAMRPHGKNNNLGAAGNSKDRKLDLRGLVEAPVSLSPTATLGQAMRLMLEHHRASVVVVEDGMPVGVVSRANVLERLAARRVEDGPLVQLIGIQDHVDAGTLDLIHNLSRRTLRKIENEFRIEFLSLHYKVYKQKSEGDEKYAVTAHLSTERKFIVAKGDDWDPIKATNLVLDEIERRSVEEKELRLERRKRSPRKAQGKFYSVA